MICQSYSPNTSQPLGHVLLDMLLALGGLADSIISDATFGVTAILLYIILTKLTL